MSAEPLARLLTVRQVVDRYLQHCLAVGTHSAEARSERERTFRVLMAYTSPAFDGVLGELPLTLCLPCYLEDLIEGNERWKSTSTRKAKANQINAAFNWAVKTKRVADNPFSGINYPEADPRPCMPDDVLGKVMVKANKHFERALVFLRLTGCRLSDLFRLCWDHIDWEKGLARLPVRKSKRNGAPRKPKPLILLDEAIELLKKVRAEDYHEGIVFRNTQGRPWNRRTLGQELDRLKDRLGIDCQATLHGIRHQVGTLAVKAGISVKFVSRLLGHSSSAITERYYVHDDEDFESMRIAAEAAKPKVVQPPEPPEVNPTHKG